MKLYYRFLKSAPLHSLLFAIFPILELWANNSDRMRPNEVVLPITIQRGDLGQLVFHDAGIENFIAYYLPGFSKKLVYSTITPDNTFRLIFNAYSGG